MSGQPETLFFSENGSVAEISRGNAGAALVNFSADPQNLAIPTTLPDGKYIDAVSNSSFTVKDSVLSGDLMPLSTYLLYVE